MSRQLTFFALVSLLSLSACGDDNENNENGSHTLQVASVDNSQQASVDAACIALVDGLLAVDMTKITDAKAANKKCVLIPILLKGENKTFWMAGPDYTVWARGVPDATGESEQGKPKDIRHATTTVEDLVAVGNFDITVHPREQDGTILWSGSVVVESIDPMGVTLQLNAGSPGERTLKVASVDANPTASVDAACLALVDARLVAASARIDTGGKVNNTQCVLVPVLLTSDNKTYWMAGPDFTVMATGAQGTNKDIRHATSTVEDLLVVGSFTISVHPRDQTTQFRWRGTVVVESVEQGRVKLQLKP
jgi:hypothetical protein